MSMDQAEPHSGQGRPEDLPKPGRHDQRTQGSPVRAALVYPVIVGYDGSGAARNALAYGAGMARRQDRPLLAAYVAPCCGPATLLGAPVAADAEAFDRWLLTELDEVASPVGLQVHVRTRLGSPARELSVLATEFSAEALVVGAPARSWRRLAGSVPGWLATHASCPVLVIP